ncbi:MAG TPA: protein-export chaperone SecB [Sutterella sp.]|jgi:preprotein translocase subunit SecB|nr:protein-export chaperone SecB [Sutterella sp.]
MAEENNTAAEQAQPVFQLIRSYLKDASLEMPHAPEIFLVQPSEQPNVDIQFEVSQSALSIPDTYEIVVRGTITVKMKNGEQDQVMFLVEGRQAGIFEMKNLPAEAIQHLANVNCPAIVYPYLRANLADIVTRTGLPPVHLPEVNFEGLYQQRLAQANEQAEQQAQAGQA